jgi:hypothetical protein
VPLAIGFGSGYDLLAISPYISAFARELQGRAIAINESNQLPGRTLRSNLRLNAEVGILFLGDIPAEPIDCFPPFRAGWKLNTDALNRGETLPAELRNPLLAFQFNYLWNVLLIQALHAVRQARSFFHKHPRTVYVDDYCAGVAQRAWAKVGRDLGIPTITVPHGAINLVEFHDAASQWTVAWGELGKENLGLAYPGNIHKVIVGGDPNMAPNLIKPSFNPKHSFENVLLLTGGYLHQLWTDFSLEQFTAAWDDLVLLARQRVHLRFTLKPHPSVRDLGVWYREFIHHRRLPNMEVVDHRPLEELLPSADLAVLVGKPGTAGFMAMREGIPCVYLDCMLNRKVIGYSFWDARNGIQKLNSSLELGELIDRLQTEPSEKDRLLAGNLIFLDRYFQEFNPNAVCPQIGIATPASLTDGKTITETVNIRQPSGSAGRSSMYHILPSS